VIIFICFVIGATISKDKDFYFVFIVCVIGFFYNLDCEVLIRANL